MRCILVTAALAACGSSRPAAEPAEPQLALAPPDAIVLDRLINPNVVSIMKTAPALFLPLRYLQPLLGAGKAPCWAALEAKLVTAYMLQAPSVDGAGRTAYYILEGDLPRAEVERCVPTAVKEVALTVGHDGDLMTLRAPDGATLYVAWRPPFIVLGARDLVTAATTAPAGLPSRWHDMLGAALPSAPLWWGSLDGLFSTLFGVTTTQYAVTFERLETSPNLYFAGRAIATYTSAGDAAIVARRIKQGEVQLPFDNVEITESFKRMRVKQTGPVVEVGFDLGMFGGITAETLADLTERVMATQQR